MQRRDKALRHKGVVLRSFCQLGNLAFSLLALGIFIPLYTRTQTNKKQKELAQKEAMANAASASFTSKLSQSPAFKAFMLDKNQKVA